MHLFGIKISKKKRYLKYIINDNESSHIFLSTAETLRDMDINTDQRKNISIDICKNIVLIERQLAFRNVFIFLRNQLRWLFIIPAIIVILICNHNFIYLSHTDILHSRWFNVYICVSFLVWIMWMLSIYSDKKHSKLKKLSDFRNTLLAKLFNIQHPISISVMISYLADDPYLHNIYWTKLSSNPYINITQTLNEAINTETMPLNNTLIKNLHKLILFSCTIETELYFKFTSTAIEYLKNSTYTPSNYLILIEKRAIHSQTAQWALRTRLQHRRNILNEKFISKVTHLIWYIIIDIFQIWSIANPKKYI